MLLARLVDQQCSLAARAFALRKAHQDLSKIFHLHVRELRAARLASQVAPPLMRVRISVPGKPDKFLTDPREVDRASIDAWAQVHQGNIGERAADSAFLGFMTAFGEFFPHAEPTTLEPITGELVLQGIAASPDNTTGLNGVQRVTLP